MSGSWWIGVLAAGTAACLGFSVEASDLPEPLVKVEAENLKEGRLDVWHNEGSLGGRFEAVEAANQPLVEVIGGRKAVNYDRRYWMQSNFSAPNSITGNNAFTVIVWAYTPTVRGHREHVLAIGRRPDNSAEFAYGGSPRGAFSSWGTGDTGFYEETPPSAGEWHHLAWSYEPGLLRIYVNGELNIERPFNLATEAGERVYLGTAWDKRDEEPTQIFTGAVASSHIFDEALTRVQIRQHMGHHEAFDPMPADASTIESLQTQLIWTPGDENDGFRVYLATDREALEADSPSEARLLGEVASGFHGLSVDTIVPGQTYYWRVDQLDHAGDVSVQGRVWSFEASDGPARAPHPSRHFGNVAVDHDTLEWQTGPWVESQNLYFGVDEDEVAQATNPVIEGLGPDVTEVTIPADLPLEHGRQYYWRVEQINAGLPDSRGEVWTFRTTDERKPGFVAFLATSDTHYNGTRLIYQSNQATLEMMNRLPGRELPENVGGGVVRTPMGVIVTGDLVDRGFHPEEGPVGWEEFTAHYSLDGTDGLLAYPSYEGFGNHDGGPGSFVREGIRERNKERPGLTMVSENGLHYSWDWEHVHLVQLNNFAGSGPEHCQSGPSPQNHDPEKSLEFLEETLKENVGDSGRPVILAQHYGWDGWGKSWWDDEARDLLEELIAGYNVVLLIAGHNHAAFIGEWRGYTYLSAGAGQRGYRPGDFFYVQIDGDELTIAQWTEGGWSQHVDQMTIEVPGGVADDFFVH